MGQLLLERLTITQEILATKPQSSCQNSILGISTTYDGVQIENCNPLLQIFVFQAQRKIFLLLRTLE
jgi:hypothetical protein